MDTTTAARVSTPKPDTYPTVSFSGCDPATFIAALWSAQCETRKFEHSRRLVEPDEVRKAFDKFREARSTERIDSDDLWHPEFLREFLDARFVVIASSEQGPTAVNVKDYDKKNGWGRAQEVADYVVAGNGWNTSCLSRRKSIAPVVLLAVAAALALAVVYARLGGFLK